MISQATLKKAISGRKLLIDSNIIIYLTDSVQPYAALAQLLFSAIENGEAEAVMSVLSIGEVMQGPIRKAQYPIAFEVRDYLVNFPNSHCQPITTEVIDKIGNDERIDWSALRSVDSLIIASGLLNNVALFVSNDRHFKKALPKEMLLAFDS